LNRPQSIAAYAEQIGSQLLRLGIDFDYARGHTQWTWWDSHGIEFDELPLPALHGDIQFDNAASVLKVLRCLHDRLPVTREAIEAGLREVSLAGRFQVFPGAVEWILDVAHNPAAAGTLARQLEMREAQGRTLAVCGILADKDVDAIGRELASSFDEWIVAGLSGSRALEPAVLGDRLRKLGVNVVASADSVADACRLAEQRAQRGDRIVVFGSFLTVGPAIEWLHARAT
jgi:dihydrofolate synthase / folylpolyglutamate synthase